MSKLSELPIVLELQKQLQNMPSRDLAALKLLGVAILLTLLYFAVWKPSQAFLDESNAHYEDRKRLLELIVSNKALLKSSASSNQSKALDSQQLVSSVTNLAKRQNLSLKRFEPSGDDKIKVWLDEASFDKMIAWIMALNKTMGIQVEQISIERENKPGLVSARLTLAS